jgi:hypothetical protein
LPNSSFVDARVDAAKRATTRSDGAFSSHPFRNIARIARIDRNVFATRRLFRTLGRDQRIISFAVCPHQPASILPDAPMMTAIFRSLRMLRHPSRFWSREGARRFRCCRSHDATNIQHEPCWGGENSRKVKRNQAA